MPVTQLTLKTSQYHKLPFQTSQCHAFKLASVINDSFKLAMQCYSDPFKLESRHTSDHLAVKCHNGSKVS